MSSQPFNSDLVLDEIIGESNLRAYCAGFEQNKFRLEPLVSLLCDVIPEFALGFHSGAEIPLPQLRQRLKDAATRVYTTDKYGKRGEFGEIVLHLLLRDFFGSIPLISKINFKDTDNATVHGFDCVHIVANGEGKKLWLGESKLYTDGKQGVKALAKDLEDHIARDYLKREFSLIDTKLPNDTEDIEYWRRQLHEYTKLEDILDTIVLPMVCTYSSDVYKNHCDATSDFVKEFVAECKLLNNLFKDKKIKTDVEVILMLLPVPSKSELVQELDKRLKAMQSI